MRVRDHLPIPSYHPMPEHHVTFPTSAHLPTPPHTSPHLPTSPHISLGEHDSVLFEEGSVLPLVVACRTGSPPEVINALLAAGAKPKPAIHAVCNPQYDLDGKTSERIELIVHATKTRELRGQAVEAQGLEKRPELNGCRGTIAGEWAGLGRWPVRLVVDDRVLSLSLKCENVVLLPKDERQTQPVAPTCAAGAGPGQGSACEDREAAPLATSTTAPEDSTASAEDDGLTLTLTLTLTPNP